MVFYRYRVLDGANYNDDGQYIPPEGEEIPGFKFYVPSFEVMVMYNTLETVNRPPEVDKKEALPNGYNHY